MLLLSGPTASGKNTIANEIAKRLEPCSIIDFDTIRAMFANPHKTPWDGKEGLAHQDLGVEIVCSIAKQFEDTGWQVIILDVLSNRTLEIYKKGLNESNFKVVQLLPNYNTLKERFDERGPVLTYEELKAVYTEQEALKGYDLRIDNSQIAPEIAAKQLIAFWQNHP